MTGAISFGDGAAVKVARGPLAGRRGVVALLDGDPPEGVGALIRVRIDGAIPPHWWIHPLWLELAQ